MLACFMVSALVNASLSYFIFTRLLQWSTRVVIVSIFGITRVNVPSEIVCEEIFGVHVLYFQDNMPGMKRDCGGAAAVLGAFRSAVELVNVLLPWFGCLCVSCVEFMYVYVFCESELRSCQKHKWIVICNIEISKKEEQLNM